MNLRHIRTPNSLSGRHRKWAFHYSGTEAKGILLLSSRISGNWTSLKYLSERIEALWLRSQDPVSPRVKLSVIELPESLLPPEEIQDIVLLFPQAPAFSVASQFRKKNPGIRITFQLSFEPSSFLRSFRSSGGYYSVKARDLFVVLCDADQILVRKVFPQAKVKTLKWMGSEIKTSRHGAVSSFCYAGRLSPGKNLELLILSYSLALRLRPGLPDLELAGKWDNGGTQFEEVHREDYERDLRGLVTSLGLDGKVRFLGHLEGDPWKNFLGEGHKLYISASLLLDENHGVAPREFVDAGHRVVLPAWGGFLDIAKKDPSVFLVSPVRNGVNLWVDPWDLAHAMIRQYEAPELRSVSIPQDERLNAIELYLSHDDTPGELEPSAWARDIHDKLSSVEEARLFQSGPYRSQHALPELRSAIMDAYAPTARTPGPMPMRTVLLPWVKNARSPEEDWEEGLSYSSDPPIASSHKGP